MTILIAIVACFILAMVLKKTEAFIRKPKEVEPVERNELTVPANPTIEDCTIWGIRNFENKLVEAGIMKVEDQEVCDDMECPFCKPTREADGSWDKYRIQKELKTSLPVMIVPANIVAAFSDRRGDAELWKSFGSPNTYFGFTFEQFCQKRQVWRKEQDRNKLSKSAPGGVKPKPAKYPPTPPNGRGAASTPDDSKKEMTVSPRNTRITTVGPYKILRPIVVPAGAMVEYTISRGGEIVNFHWVWYNNGQTFGFNQPITNDVLDAHGEDPNIKNSSSLCVDCGVYDATLCIGRCSACQNQNRVMCKDCGSQPPTRFGICLSCEDLRAQKTKNRKPLPCVIVGCETMTRNRFQLCSKHADRENIQIASKELGIDRLNEVNTKPKVLLNELNAKVKELEQKNKKFKEMTKELEQRNKQINALLANTTVDELLGTQKETS